MREVNPLSNPPLLETLTPAAEKLAARIKNAGPVSVAEFMQVAASHYYAAKDAFGVEGDFITAPEISQMFGEMIGAWLVDSWMQLGKPADVKLIELGPGRGTLAADIMRTISSWPDCKAAFSLHLVEASPLLRQKQAELLIRHAPTWYETLEEVPVGLCFIVANEFLDALPIEQFVKTAAGWRERGVGWEGGKFVFTLLGAADVPVEFANVPEGNIFETSSASIAVMKNISCRIEQNGGAGLLVDYGHVTRGLGDTLQSLHHHKFSPALAHPGRDDITAHVDFAACAEAAGARARVHGPVTQGEFLARLGIVQRAEALAEKADEGQRWLIEAALQRLVSPSAMGRLFKVLGLTANGSSIKPAGFSEDNGHEVSNDGS